MTQQVQNSNDEVNEKTDAHETEETSEGGQGASGDTNEELGEHYQPLVVHVETSDGVGDGGGEANEGIECRHDSLQKG